MRQKLSGRIGVDETRIALDTMLMPTSSMVAAGCAVGVEIGGLTIYPGPEMVHAVWRAMMLDAIGEEEVPRAGPGFTPPKSNTVMRCMGPWPSCGHPDGSCTAGPSYQLMALRG